MKFVVLSVSSGDQNLKHFNKNGIKFCIGKKIHRLKNLEDLKYPLAHLLCIFFSQFLQPYFSNPVCIRSWKFEKKNFDAHDCAVEPGST